MDIKKLRAETPHCETLLHFNNAGASLQPQPVLDTVFGYLQRESELGGYETAVDQAHLLNNTYDAVAELLNSSADEIALVESATHAWDKAFFSIPLEAGDVILTSKASYVSNFISFLRLVRQKGIVIRVAPDDEHGQVDVAALQNMLTPETKVIALTHMPTNSGLLNPAEKVGAVAKEAGVWYILDACQTAGQLPLDVNTLHCDFLSATSRKFLRGPRGAGFLYVRQSRLEELGEPPMLDMSGADWVARSVYHLKPTVKRYENFETSYAVRAGLGTAVRYALNLGLDNIWQRVTVVADTLRQQLSQIKGVTVQDKGAIKGGIVTFTVDGHNPADLQQALYTHKINVSITTASSARLDMDERNLPALIRSSVHYYNTEEEINRFCQTLQGLIS